MRFNLPLSVGLTVSLLAAPVASADYPAHPKTAPDINAADLAARVKALSEDAFEGRGPGTKNGEAAATWIADEMKRIGLKPGNKGSYFQNVPTVNITPELAKYSFSFATPKGALTPKFGEETVYWTPQFAGNEVKVTQSQLIFAGYGVIAPEYGWNDYAGVDVKGKTVVLLVNDPGNEDKKPDPDLFKGRAMTYYGRWTYKYEEAARQGAAAAIIVHETVPAGYGWQVVRNSNSGTKSWLDAENKQLDRVPIQGWITLDTAKELFKRAGLDYEKQKAAANKRGFKAVPMEGASLTATARVTIDHLTSRNIIGVVPGRKRPNEYLVYTAHWDHLGVKPEAIGDDKIHNGAVDNATGTAAVLEIGEAFAKDRRRPDRSVAIIGWTLEEQGLLGSEYFAKNPIWPPKQIVGGVNIDGTLPKGRARDLVLVGKGASELEDLLSKVLKTQNRTITPDPEPEKGYFYRSDHINLSKAGVPMLYPGGGYDLIEGGTAAGQAVRNDYRQNRYHQPSDEFDLNWDWSGIVQDLDALYTVGDELANGDAWPNWYADNEFRAIRDQSRAGK
ncbi:MAG: M28 family metallopeptidase [Alphaproteobacteria bacterium]